MTDAFYGGLTFKVGDGEASETFTTLEEVADVDGFGEILELIEATHFGSGGSKEYIAGLADGKEITVTCNKVQLAPQQQYVRANRGITGNLQIDLSDGTTVETYDFAAVYMGWDLDPNNADKNNIAFTFKISGGITES
jgi:hypothetical protein